MSFLLCFLLAAPAQEGVDALMDRLTDDRVEVRSAAARRLIELYPSGKEILRQREESGADAEVRAQLRSIAEAGEQKLSRQAFSRALAPRVRESYPELEWDLYSGDFEKRDHALRVIARSATEAGPDGDPHRSFFMSPAECRAVAPELVGLLRGGEAQVPIRLAWIELISKRTPLLQDPRVQRATRELFNDESPRVRLEALQRLHSTSAFDEQALRFLQDVDSLGKELLPLLDQGLVARRISAGRPYLAKRLQDPEHAERIAGLVLNSGVRPWIPELLQAFESGVEFSSYILKDLPPAEVRRVLIRRLGGTTKDKLYVFTCLDQLKIDGLAEQAARELSCEDWKVRGVALAYLQQHAGTSTRQPEAVARCLAEFWESAGKDAGYSPYNCAYILAGWKAGREVEALIPHARTLGALWQLSIPLLAIRPPGAAAKLVKLARADDLQYSGYVLKYLSDLDAKDEFLSCREIVLRILAQTDPKIWSEYGFSLAHQAARFGMKECIPVLMGWKDGDNRRWVAASMLGDLWTADQKVEALHSSDPWLRYLGCWAIAYKGPAEAAEQLLAQSENEDPEVRSAVASCLAQFGAADQSDLALRLSRDKNAHVSGPAASSFLKLRCPKCPQEYSVSSDGGWDHGYVVDFKADEGLLQHPSKDIRLAALRGLTPEIVRAHPKLLDPILKDPDPKLQEIATQLAEETLGPEDPEHMARRYLESRTDACDLTWGVPKLCDKVAPEILMPLVERFLQDVQSGKKVITDRTFSHGHGDVVYDRVSVEASAARLLGRWGRDSGEVALLKLLESATPRDRFEALRDPGGFRSAKAASKLIEMLSTQMGHGAARALGEIGTFPPDFLESAKPDLALRLQAVRLAADRKHFDAAAALLSHSNYAVGMAAVEAIGALARTEDTSRILRLAFTPVARFRAMLLGILAGYSAPELAGEIASFLEDEPEVSIAAARFLVAQNLRIDREKLPVDLDVAPIATVLELLPVIGRTGARSLMPRLLGEVRPTGNENRSYEIIGIAKVLAVHGDPDTLSELLARIEAMPADRRSGILTALAQGYGKGVLGYLRDKLRSGSDFEMSEAARALADLDDQESAPEIERVLVGAAYSQDRGLDAVALLRLQRREAAQGYVAKYKDARTLAVAVHSGLHERMGDVAGLLRRPRPEGLPMIQALNRAWSPGLQVSQLQWTPQDGLAALEHGVRLRGRSGLLRITFAPGIRDQVDLRRLRRSWSASDTVESVILKLNDGPYPARWSCFLLAEDQILVDEVDKVRDCWLERLSN